MGDMMTSWDFMELLSSCWSCWPVSAAVSGRTPLSALTRTLYDFVALQSWTNCLKFGDSVEDCRSIWRNCFWSIDTLCSGSGLFVFFFVGGGSFSSWAWTCAFLRHDLPLHLVTCGGDASHMTVQIKAASHRKTSMFSQGTLWLWRSARYSRYSRPSSKT